MIKGNNGNINIFRWQIAIFSVLSWHCLVPLLPLGHVGRAKLYTHAGFSQHQAWGQVSRSPKAPQNAPPLSHSTSCQLGSVTERAA